MVGLTRNGQISLMIGLIDGL
uniref:Uncharacterized protein n=1 Tax=Arundo donax TaxID=35708 RepID=A0A0A9A5L1_ARUDO